VSFRSLTCPAAAVQSKTAVQAREEVSLSSLPPVSFRTLIIIDTLVAGVPLVGYSPHGGHPHPLSLLVGESSAPPPFVLILSRSMQRFLKTANPFLTAFFFSCPPSRSAALLGPTHHLAQTFLRYRVGHTGDDHKPFPSFRNRPNFCPLSIGRLGPTSASRSVSHSE